MRNAQKYLTKLSATALFIGLAGCGGGSNGSTTFTDETVVDPALPVSDWQLVWSDDFDGAAIDNAKWNLAIDCSGGGNQEKQCYTDSADNAFLADGNLNIVALPAPEDAVKPYTSAKLDSKMKADFTYGRFEVRAKLPSGQGSWPAVWMLPTDDVYGGWPHSGEIDIVEAVNLKTSDADGNIESYVHGTLHYGKSYPDNDQSGKAYLLPADANPADDFHTYAVEWQEGEIRWYVDGYLYQTQLKSALKFNSKGTASLKHKGWYTHNFDTITGELATSWDNAPYDQDFHMILNLAVGGDWPENVNNGGVDASAFAAGQTMQIDFVRVYECISDPETGKGCDTVRTDYKVEADEEHPSGALILGKAPAPPLPPVAGPATPLVLFADAVNEQWPLWDCCGGTIPTVVTDDAAHGEVARFEVVNGEFGGTVLGFSGRDTGASFNASSMIQDGTLEFDLKVTALPAVADTAWMLKVESNGGLDAGGAAAEVALSTSDEGHSPQLDNWLHFTFQLSDLDAAGLDLSAIDVMMLFPAWGNGQGAVFLVDNVIFSQPGAGAGPSVDLFSDAVNPQWVPWDCCGGTTPTVVTDDAEHGAVTEFVIVNGEFGGTVVGYAGRDALGATNAVAFDASSIIASGILEFDLKLMSLAAVADTDWILKVESNGGADAGGTFSEFSLSNNDEGHLIPVVDTWQHYTFKLSDLDAAGLDLSAIDVVMIFPAWGNGEGAVFRVDNVRIGQPAVVTPSVVLFDNAINPQWVPWDCCGGTTPVVVTDDASHGEVTEFVIVNGEFGGTVVGYAARDTLGATDAQTFDASSIIAGGKLEFDLKLISPAAVADTDWILKLESDGGADAGGTFSEFSLSNNDEGHVIPVVDTWQHYTFKLSDLDAAGLDISAIDMVMIFPAWGNGEGAIFRVDNVTISAN